MSSQEIPNSYREAVARAISLNLPFALFASPGSREYTFFASHPDDVDYNAVNKDILQGQAFFITRFAAPFSHGVLIKNQLTADDVIALPASTEPWPSAELTTHSSSTTYPVYYGQLRSFRQAISRRKITKAVLSRRIAFESDIDIIELTERYFSSLPNTFRALYFTQETGLWITATPELLLGAISQDDDVTEDLPLLFESMSLAGTRSPASDSEEWDEKNKREHTTVLDFIFDTFKAEGLDPVIHSPTRVNFGGVEHLCHKISGKGHANIFELVDLLSPTPALGGFPVDTAVKLIGETELHNRYCYGGVIGTINQNSLLAYVNIRCAMLSPAITKPNNWLVNLFAGGGIMKDSKPQREWVEAASKAMPLYSIFRPDAPDEISAIPAQWSKIKE